MDGGERYNRTTGTPTGPVPPRIEGLVPEPVQRKCWGRGVPDSEVRDDPTPETPRVLGRVGARSGRVVVVNENRSSQIQRNQDHRVPSSRDILVGPRPLEVRRAPERPSVSEQGQGTSTPGTGPHTTLCGTEPEVRVDLCAFLKDGVSLPGSPFPSWGGRTLSSTWAQENLRSRPRVVSLPLRSTVAPTLPYSETVVRSGYCR